MRYKESDGLEPIAPGLREHFDPHVDPETPQPRPTDLDADAISTEQSLAFNRTPLNRAQIPLPSLEVANPRGTNVQTGIVGKGPQGA